MGTPGKMVKENDRMITAFQAQKATHPDWNSVTQEPGMLRAVITNVLLPVPS